MELTSDQYARIASLFPKQRGNVGLSNLQVLNAILYAAEHGCRWPRPAGAFRQPAHDLHTHEPVVEEGCARSGIRAEQLQRERMVRIRVKAYGLDNSTSIKAHPDGMGVRKKTVDSRSAGPGVAGTPASYGCRGCPNSCCLHALPRPRT